MNGQKEAKLINIGIIIVVILALSILIRIVFILPEVSNDDICRFEYGNNWSYEYHDNFGKTCVKMDHVSLNIINRTQQNLTWKEARSKYCSYPGFWELNKWGWECKDD